MRTLIVILIIALVAALMWTPSVDVSDTKVYTHETMCEKNKTLPECQKTEDNSAAIAGVVGQM